MVKLRIAGEWLLAGCLALSANTTARSQPMGADAGPNPAVQEISPSRYSLLTLLDAHNVSRLRPSFSFRSGRRGAQAGAPLIVGSTLYWLTSFPHVLFALDLARAGAPVRWQFAPQADPLAAGLACCNRIEHGPVFGSGRIYFSTLDGRVIALEPDMGRVVWNVVVADIHNGETLVSAPTVNGDQVLIGNGGDDFGARGYRRQTRAGQVGGMPAADAIARVRRDVRDAQGAER